MKLAHLLLATSLCLSATVFAATGSDATYLALGDSVAFGLNEALLPPYSQQTPTPSQFVGYPEALSAFGFPPQVKKEVNASCPGETSGSFLDTSSPDNGCNSPHLQPPAPTIPAFKTGIGLHTAYTVAQIDFAESQFDSDKHISLVTLSIGANDVLLVLPQLVQCAGDPTCAQSVLAPVLQSYAANLGVILTRIRAHYQGTLLLLTYYAPAPALDSIAQAVNSVMTQVAAQVSSQLSAPRILIADGYTTFKLVSARFQGDACQAGLLIRFPPSPFNASPCDIHPSPLGRNLLAATIEAALLARH